jgi:hypothetical protein
VGDGKVKTATGRRLQIVAALLALVDEFIDELLSLFVIERIPIKPTLGRDAPQLLLRVLHALRTVSGGFLCQCEQGCSSTLR